jgi:cytochrome c peroxidase
MCVAAAIVMATLGCQKTAPSAKPKAKEQAVKPEDKPKSPTPTPDEPKAKAPDESKTKPADEPKAPTKPAEPKPHEPPAKAPETSGEVKPPPSKPAEKVAAKPVAYPVPRGLPPLPVPADNPMTPEKIELGKMLYFDKRVSKDGTVSCATCHDPKMGWAEKTPTSAGIGKQVGPRNSPTVMNAAYATSMFWDGRAASLEEQATGPVENPIEMGHQMADLVAQLDKIPEYHERFQKVFGTGVTKEGFAKAIAAFERTILVGDSPYDRFKGGDQNALTEAQKRGLALFESVGCADCHAPPLFSDYEFHNAGVGMDKEKPDQGRKDVTKKDEDTGAFRVPSLRNVADTAPYFHDGSAKTLEEAVALMAAGGKDNKYRSADFDAVRNAKVTPEQQKDLVEFLKALSGPIPAVEPPALP